MKRVKFFVVGAVWLIAGLALQGCSGCKQKDPKYDVAIKVANNYGMEWIFEPGVDELCYEFEYTGEEMTFGVDAYYVYDAPHGGDRWLDCAGVAGNYFGGSSPLYTSPTGEQYNTEIIKERGEYSIAFHTNRAAWNFRSIRLFVTVK